MVEIELLSAQDIELPKYTSSPIHFSAAEFDDVVPTISDEESDDEYPEVIDELPHSESTVITSEQTTSPSSPPQPPTTEAPPLPTSIETITTTNTITVPITTIEQHDTTSNVKPEEIEAEPIPKAEPESPSITSPSEPHNYFPYNAHNESIYDDENIFPALNTNSTVVKFDELNPELINHATLKALMVQLTSPEIIDYNLICDFFLTYRTFVSSVEVMNLLLTRLIWSLQYIHSNDSNNVKIGKLVLLRTFVVLRHWILNYFVDDFEPNSSICDTFTTLINEITIELDFINKEEMIFERKVFTDLKIHWINSINEFWNTKIDIELITLVVLPYKLPLISEVTAIQPKKLSKSNTDMSIHTNPSYRRSAMLSLYDQKVHHKCLIFDDVSNDENPQMSINNLLLQHKLSRASLNNQLQQLKTRKDEPHKQRKPLTTTNKHNHINLQDSSVGLKRTTRSKDELEDGKDEAEEEEEEREEREEKEKSFVPKRHTDSPSFNEGNTGFSTNGNVKLPSSKVETILPPTPVKKMEYTIKSDYLTNDISTMPAPNAHHSVLSEDNEMVRKTSIKRLVDGWKKSFHHAQPVSSVGTSTSNDNNDLDTLITKTINVMTEEDRRACIGDRVDILSARIIDELEYLIRYYIKNEASPNTILEDHNDELDNEHSIAVGTPSKKRKSTRSNDELPEHNIDINDISDLNIVKIDNLLNVEPGEEMQVETEENKELGTEDQSLEEHIDLKESSFQRPASINWNDEGNLEFEHSDGQDLSLSNSVLEDDIEHVDAGHQDVESCRTPRKDRANKSGTQYFDVSSEFENEDGAFISPTESDQSFRSSISTPSNITQYDADVADLGIVLSPQKQNQSQAQLLHSLLLIHAHKRISFNEANINYNQKRLSIISRTSSSSIFKRDSVKSYISYDSVFSSSNGSTSNKVDNSGFLRKKTGYNNLRGNIKGERDSSSNQSVPVRNSFGSYPSRSSSLRKSIRLSTLCALTELPFNNYDDSLSAADVTSTNTSNVNTHSRKYSTKSVKLLEVADSSIFSVAIKCKKASRTARISNTSSGLNSVAIPGISNYVLKELAAIPDESFRSNDPIEFALYKLEGKGNKLRSANMPDDTQEILDEINNAQTQDVIELTDVDITEEEPLTPGQRISAIENSTIDIPRSSTPKQDFMLMDGNRSGGTNSSSNMLNRTYPSPKAILDAYSMTTESLRVESVLQANSHVSFVLSYDSKTLAEHFTAIEQDILQEIDWKELIELKWNKDLQPVNSWLEIIVNDNYYSQNKGVNLVISRFNLMVNWIISEILLTQTQTERINLISRFIHIAQNCFALQNFSTLMQIILGLTSEKVTKLKETWKNLPPGDILMLKNLEDLASPLKNFLNIRLCINHMKPSKGCIPFVGLYLSDLIFNAERPAFIKPPKTTPPVEGADLTTSTAGTLGEEKVINFSRFRTSVHIVKSLSQCIEWSTYYKIPIKNELLSKCLYVRSLDEDEMNICLRHIADQYTVL